jgi:hypothetical protein
MTLLIECHKDFHLGRFKAKGYSALYLGFMTIIYAKGSIADQIIRIASLRGGL